jgi:hypothetical protein
LGSRLIVLVLFLVLATFPAFKRNESGENDYENDYENENERSLSACRPSGDDKGRLRPVCAGIVGQRVGSFREGWLQLTTALCAVAPSFGEYAEKIAATLASDGDEGSELERSKPAAIKGRRRRRE